MKNFDEKYWTNRWQEGKTAWDVGYATPAIVDYFKDFYNKDVAVLIPGCGNAYEAKVLLDLGFSDITVIEIVKEKALQLEQEFGGKIKVIAGDFFELEAQYDFIIEQTFFCSLHPEMRISYVKKMHDLLKDGGKLVGVLFYRTFNSDEPPFGGNIEEYSQLFEPLFKEVMIAQCYNSIPPRAGNELFIKLEK
jgi:SAM-dependent methyltransferase